MCSIHLFEYIKPYLSNVSCNLCFWIIQQSKYSFLSLQKYRLFIQLVIKNLTRWKKNILARFGTNLAKTTQNLPKKWHVGVCHEGIIF